jgi:hypothetical protein
MIENFIKHEPLILIPLRTRGHEPPLHECFGTVLLVRVESEYPVIDYLYDVAECCCGDDFSWRGEGPFAADCGVIAWFWETGSFC